MTTFSIQSFGCRVNQAEAFEWAEALQVQGLRLVKNYLRSDLIIVNTCALTAGAERDVRKFLRRIARLNPQARLAVTGCAVPLLKEEIENHPQIGLIISNEEKAQLLSCLLEKELIWATRKPEEEVNQFNPFRSRALIKIQDGCSHACTFCLIPQVRGPSRSLPPTEILDRMKHLIQLGFKEIILAGIHLTSYAQEDGSQSSLLDLLKQATELNNLGRIRLSSLDPRDMEDDLIDFIAGHEKICQHFHLSLQHASSHLLRRMGRKGGSEDYQKILNRLRQESPYASLGADIIVGFPGETEEDYIFLENFIFNSPLSYLHVFPYSPRPGTPAARWPQPGVKIKKERAGRLRSLGRRKNYEFRRTLLGLVFEGVVVGEKKTLESEVLTHNYLKVRVAGKLREGEAVAVKIEEVTPEATKGTILTPWEK